MAVSATVRPIIKGFGGNPVDPRLPLGYWFARGTVLGDATGGTADITFQFGTASYIYSVERLFFNTGSSTITVCRMSFNGDEIVSGNQSEASEYQLDGATVDAGGITKIQVAGGLPDFFRASVTSNFFFDAVEANPGAGNTFIFGARGYYWSPLADRISGGPIKPQGFLPALEPMVTGRLGRPPGPGAL